MAVEYHSLRELVELAEAICMGDCTAGGYD